jgi:heme exporter protein A
MSEQRPIIEIEKLVKAYGFLPVLKGIDLSLERGQFLALLGPNGSGKSTLLRLLTGLTKPTQGRITIGGWDMPQEAAAVRGQIGLVSHKSLLYDNLTARENLRFYADLYDLPSATLKSHIDGLLVKVGLGKRGDSLVRTFSRGMLQRLSIARALLHDPHVLLFDEPYTGLDQDAGGILDDLLLQSQADGHTVIMATHQLERAARLCERVVILSRGKVAYDGHKGDYTPTTLPNIYSDVTGAVSARQ